MLNNKKESTMSKKIIPIQITSLDYDLTNYIDNKRTSGTFETTHLDTLIAHGLESEVQPYLLLGKDGIYDAIPAILEKIESDLALWLTSSNESKRKIAQLITKWKKDG